MMLYEIKMPLCEACGSRMSHVVKQYREWDGNDYEKRECHGCGRRWSVRMGQPDPEPEEDGAVRYKSAEKGGAQCPQCGAFPVRTVSTPKVRPGDTAQRRYHKCRKCGWHGASTEKIR